MPKKKAKKATEKKTTKKKVSRKKKTTKKAAKKKVARKKATKKKTSKKKIRKKTTKKKVTKKKTSAKKASTKIKTSNISTGNQIKTQVSSGKVSLGSKVSNFSVSSTAKSPFKLSDFKGKHLVIYFYPKDSTPGCTVEGHDFTRLHSQFKKIGAEVFGVSKDSLKSHFKFIEKQNYSFDLLSDETEELCKYFEVMKEKNMYGRKYFGIERSTFIIDPNGKLVKEWRKVKVPGHAEEVLNSLKELA